MKLKDYGLLALLALGVGAIFAFPASQGDVSWLVVAGLAVATFVGGIFVLSRPDNVFVQPLPIGFGITLGLGLANIKMGLFWWIPLAVGLMGYGAGLLLFRWQRGQASR